MIQELKEKIGRTFRFTIYTLLLLIGGGGVGGCLSSCSSFLYDDESEQVIYADKSHLDEDADTLWSMAGILGKMQALADRTILLGELRGDLVEVTTYASSDLRAIASFSTAAAVPAAVPAVSPAGLTKYDQPRDYYAVINNCNYFLANADTTLRNNRNERIFQKEYAAVKAFRAWTYLQLVLNYGQVPFITQPVLSKEESERQYPLYDLQQVCQYFISDISPYATVETPGYLNIRNTDSKLFYYPINVLLGDLYLWSGQYKEAAQSYYRFLSSRNGTNTASPLTTNAVRFSQNDSRWMSTVDSWSLQAFMMEAAGGELITMIPGDSIPSEGQYSELRDLFNTNDNNEYRESITPSQSLIALSRSQKYCHYTTGGEFVFAPDALEDNLTGDLRLHAAYTTRDNANLFTNGKRVSHYASISKYQTRNVHILRLATVYLRLAEALNRAGYPRFAFQILKSGVNNSVIESEVIPYYPASEAAWLRTFDFPNTSYVLETTAGLAAENTMGLHSRGSGYTAQNAAYVFPDDPSISDSLARQQYQMEQVEDLIIDEEALELAFEGQRFYDLMRVALRRNQPAYLADRVARRSGTLNTALQQKLMDPASWYLKLEE
ncbi:MAG: RagB/SusD family nutrient uptake outer membrane protein [Prevotella sp.]|nr:RagB/SusD family nutrient uptake outer membrane protein [Prevotella sp.]